jgi:hypothetical protein
MQIHVVETLKPIHRDAMNLRCVYGQFDSQTCFIKRVRACRGRIWLAHFNRDARQTRNTVVPSLELGYNGQLP